eukprot:887495-Prymnesium_polylepis.1
MRVLFNGSAWSRAPSRSESASCDETANFVSLRRARKPYLQKQVHFLNLLGAGPRVYQLCAVWSARRKQNLTPKARQGWQERGRGPAGVKLTWRCAE